MALLQARLVPPFDGDGHDLLMRCVARSRVTVSTGLDLVEPSQFRDADLGSRMPLLLVTVCPSYD